jgi:hypothetical protein
MTYKTAHNAACETAHEAAFKTACEITGKLPVKTPMSSQVKPHLKLPM